MRFYEVLVREAYERNMRSDNSSMVQPCFTWSQFVRWSIIMAGCDALTRDEETELANFPTLQCLVYDDGLYDIYEVSVEYIHLYSLHLHEVITRQNLSSDMSFLEIQLFTEKDPLYPRAFVAVRYGFSLCIPCLRPLPIYRVVLEDYGKGHKLYKRRGSLLVLDKEKVSPQHRLFRVADVEEKPLVVREDVLEQWLEWGIEVDFQEVYVE